MTERPRRKTTVLVVLPFLLLIMVVAGWLANRQVPQESSDRTQIVVVSGVPTQVPGPKASEQAREVVAELPPMRVSQALGLGAQARTRNAVQYDRKYDIVCGEVSRTGYETDYRRFVYVGVAATADIDDGSADFATRVSDVCKQQRQ